MLIGVLIHILHQTVNVISRFVVPQKSIMFIEPSERANKILLADHCTNVYDVTKNKKIRTKKLKYRKVILYFRDDDNNIVVIDEGFEDMFLTAYVKISNLPKVFVGKLEDYQTLVYLLYKQMKFTYDEKELYISKFRCDVFNTIFNLYEGCFEKE